VIQLLFTNVIRPIIGNVIHSCSAESLAPSSGVPYGGHKQRGRHKVFNRQRLTELVRQGTPRVAATSPDTRSVDSHIARIRAKLRALGDDCIHTMRNVGYRFVPPSLEEQAPGRRKARPES
jgi:hypothetical protein